MPRVVHRFPTVGALLTPYFNRWNANVYLRTEPFSENPWQVSAGSTSGAAVAIAEKLFVGLTRADAEARFQWDGRELVVEAAPDDLWVAEGLAAEQAWQGYHRRLGTVGQAAPFGRMPEYCTWVEQVARCGCRQLPGEVLGEALVDELLDSVDTLAWPRGRFTVDEGWAPRHGPGGYGDWEPRGDFDPGAVAARIAARGHVPGLWLAPALICPGSRAAREQPSLVGARVDMPGETPWNRFHYVRPGPASAALIGRLFLRAWEWGFRKLKLDILYGPRIEMLALARQCRAAADALPGRMELESHVPDPLIAGCFDVVRVNDVLISGRHPDWRPVVEAHFAICAASAPGHLLCLDHIGGNAPEVTSGEFLQHGALMRGQFSRGYPVVGLWPTRLGQETVEAVTALLLESSHAHRMEMSEQQVAYF